MRGDQFSHVHYAFVFNLPDFKMHKPKVIVKSSRYATAYEKASRLTQHQLEQNRAIVRKAKATKLNEFELINELHNLQAIVVADLEPDEIHWLRQRDKGSITKHINGGMPVIGLVLDGELLGMALLAFPENPEAENVDDYPIPKGEESTSMIIQSFIVAPGLRKTGAGRKLMAIIEEQAIIQLRPNLYARVATDNNDSIAVFQGTDFYTTGPKVQRDHDKLPNGYLANHWHKVVNMNPKLVRPPVVIGNAMKPARVRVRGISRKAPDNTRHP